MVLGFSVSLQNAWQLYRISEAAQQRQLTLVQLWRNVAIRAADWFQNAETG